MEKIEVDPERGTGMPPSDRLKLGDADGVPQKSYFV